MTFSDALKELEAGKVIQLGPRPPIKLNGIGNLVETYNGQWSRKNMLVSKDLLRNDWEVVS